MKEIELPCGTHVTIEILKAHAPVARVTIDDREEAGTLRCLENEFGDCIDLKKAVILIERASIPEIIKLLQETQDEMENSMGNSMSADDLADISWSGTTIGEGFKK